MADVRIPHPPLIWDIATSLPVATLLVDARESVIFANPAWAGLTGTDEEDALGHGWQRVLSARDARTAARLISAAVHEGVGGNARFRVETPRGPSATIWHVAPHRVALDDCRAIVVAHEATKPIAQPARAAEVLPSHAALFDMLDAALRAALSRKRLVALLTISIDGIDEIRRQRGHAIASKVASVITERIRSSMRPHDVRSEMSDDQIVILCPDLPGEDAAARIAARLNNTIATPVGIGDDEVRVTPCIGVATGSRAADDRTSTWFRSTTAMEAARAAGGGVVIRGHRPGMAAVQEVDVDGDDGRVEELTDRVEEQARLIGEVAHVLTSSFTVLRGWGDMLMQRWDDLDDDTRLHGVNAMRHEAVDAIRVAQGLLDVAHAERVGLEISRTSTDVVQLVEGLVRDRPSTGAGVDVTVEVDGEVPAVLTDAGLVRMIVDELLDNAIKYSSGLAPVVVRIRASGDADVLVDVVNEGVPLTDDIDPFAPFVRAREASHVTGTGLGLYVARRLAQRLGVELTAHPRATGARFALWLPADV